MLIVYLLWAADESRELVDPVPDNRHGVGGYRKGSVYVPPHAVKWAYDDAANDPPKVKVAKNELHQSSILTALDGMGGRATSKEQLFKAVGGNRTKFFAALQVLIEAGQVRSDGRRIIVQE